MGYMRRSSCGEQAMAYAEYMWRMVYVYEVFTESAEDAGRW